MTNFKRNLAFLAILLLISQHVFAQLSIDEIIDKHLKVIGLQPSEQKISTFEISGNLIQNQFTSPIEMFGILPSYQRMNMFFNGIAFIKASDGKTDWELNPMKDTLIVKEGKQNQAANFYSRWTGGLTEYKEGKISGELLGVSNIEDIEAYKLKMKKGDKVRIYYIDKLSYLLLRVDDEDKDSQKTTYYSDYKSVDSYLLAHKLQGFEFGKLTMVMEFKTIRVNIPVEKDLFKVPEKE